jgi:hypothetical protein
VILTLCCRNPRRPSRNNKQQLPQFETDFYPSNTSLLTPRSSRLLSPTPTTLWRPRKRRPRERRPRERRPRPRERRPRKRRPRERRPRPRERRMPWRWRRQRVSNSQLMMDSSFYLAITFLSSHHKHLLLIITLIVHCHQNPPPPKTPTSWRTPWRMEMTPFAGQWIRS